MRRFVPTDRHTLRHMSFRNDELVAEPVVERGRDRRMLRRRVRRRRLGVLLVVLLLLLTPVGWSLAGALTRPGTDSTAARVAEWARDHHAGALVTWMERKTYRQPKVGGAPPPTSPLSAGRPPRRSRQRSSCTASRRPSHRSRRPRSPGEGQWRVLDVRHRHPALAVAYLRPDAKHTSYTAMVAWINPLETRAVWHPGSTEPGHGPWPTRTSLTGSDRTRLAAAFNSAFRLKDSKGGLLAGGRTLRKLRAGAASLVIDKQGRITVGAWGIDVSRPRTSLSYGRTSRSWSMRRQLVPGHRAQQGRQVGRDHRQLLLRLAVRDRCHCNGRRGLRCGRPAFGAERWPSCSSVPAPCARWSWTSIRTGPASWSTDRPASSAIERNALPDMKQSPRRYDQTSSRDFVALYLR